VAAISGELLIPDRVLGCCRERVPQPIEVVALVVGVCAGGVVVGASLRWLFSRALDRMRW